MDNKDYKYYFIHNHQVGFIQEPEEGKYTIEFRGVRQEALPIIIRDAKDKEVEGELKEKLEELIKDTVPAISAPDEKMV